ncbi:MAG: hypothetical protein ACRYGM_11800 [Janthinobacterium lividum]
MSRLKLVSTPRAPVSVSSSPPVAVMAASPTGAEAFSASQPVIHAALDGVTGAAGSANELAH